LKMMLKTVNEIESASTCRYTGYVANRKLMLEFAK
jgi:hypothetical protein